MKIRSKLFLIIIGILLINLGITFIFARTFIGELYTRTRTRELVRIQSDIKDVYWADEDVLASYISLAEQKNITVLIFSMSGKNAKIEYFSRSTEMPQGMNEMMRGRYSPVNWINFAYNNGYLDSLSKSDTKVMIIQTDPLLRISQGPAPKSINVFSLIGDDTYLFLETPLEQIENAAILGVRYMLLISLGTLVLAAVVILIVSRKITAPILEASQIANRIANLDFKDKCMIGSDDELGELGKSINAMSDRLKDNLERLTVMNSILRQDLEKEEASNRMRREFIANVSHDFKTPITLIAAYGESIKDIVQDPESRDKSADIRDQCDIIISESRKMDDLVNQLLRLAMLENRTVVIHEEEFDPDEMISGVIQNSQILLKEKNLVVEYESVYGRKAYADHSKTLQMMQNLLDNAIKHSAEGAYVKIFIEDVVADNSDYVYRVKIYNDAKLAPGTDPDDFFASFYKGDDSRSLQDKSYGLGLAIVRAIADLHGRECGAYAEGEGIVFWFDILKSSGGDYRHT